MEREAFVKFRRKYYRKDFYSKKPPLEIKKDYPVEVRLPSHIGTDTIINKIWGLESDEHVRIDYRCDLIPEKWKLKAGTKNQSEIMHHGPSYFIDVERGRPTAVIKHTLKEIKEPYTYFYWIGHDGRKKSHRTIDIFNANLLFQGSELIDEKIEVKGSCKEVECVVFARTPENEFKKKYDFVFIHLPITDGLEFYEWKDTEGSCYCKYKQYFKTHYLDHWCPHEIASLRETKNIENLNMSSYIFPKLTELGMDFFEKCRDRVVKNGRNLNDTEIDRLIQEETINNGPEKLLDFSD